MRRKLLFLVLVAVFTIFFAGPSQRWKSLGPDLKTGDLYFFEERTLKRDGPECYLVTIQRRSKSRASSERFRVDTRAGTLQNLTRHLPPEPIPPQSVAATLLLRLQEYRKGGKTPLMLPP